MSDRDKFHENAVKSVLFKGHSDWYFCYLKSEKIVHVLALLARSDAGEKVKEIRDAAARIPTTFLHFAAGKVSTELLLADLFSITSSIRVGTTGGVLTQQNGAILIQEYEKLIEKITTGHQPSPFISSEDFAVPITEKKELPSFISNLGEAMPAQLKDSHKGQNIIKDTLRGRHFKVNRGSQILELVRKSNGISIKGISGVVRNCSEKTIQRELVALIHQGLVRKVGERRWSVYVATGRE